MSLLDIHTLGAPILRVETRPVTEITDDVRRLAEDMFETMQAAQGIGLAAPQVGREERLAVIDVDARRYVIINPEVVHEEGEHTAEEGCLSIPEVYGDVTRSERVVVRATDVNGASFEIAASDLLARCLLHEIDHLHGRLFIDYFSLLKRRAALNIWEKQRGKYPDNIRRLEPLPPAQAPAGDPGG